MNTIFVWSIVYAFACQQPELPKEEKSLYNSIPEPPPPKPYNPPPMPMSGMVLSKSVDLVACLDKVPSCVCDAVTGDTCYPQFASEVREIPHLMQEKMIQYTWNSECPVAMEDLRLLRVLHWTEMDSVVWGEIILSKTVVEQAQKVFERLYALHFPIHKMTPVDHYQGSDDDSMEDNNSSGFNCRKVSGTSRWSEHSYGESIDINPLWNPWIKGSKILPKEGKKFKDRENIIPGMIHENAKDVLQAFAEQGWVWGSQKPGISDYQHFARQQ
jgi:hypothetical protein